MAKTNKTTLTIEQSLESIAIRLDELTGNSMGGNSYLKLDMEPIELDGIEDRLNNIEKQLENIGDTLVDISDNMQSLSNISDTLENMLGWYIQFNENKKTK